MTHQMGKRRRTPLSAADGIIEVLEHPAYGYGVDDYPQCRQHWSHYLHVHAQGGSSQPNAVYRLHLIFILYIFHLVVSTTQWTLLMYALGVLTD